MITKYNPIERDIFNVFNEILKVNEDETTKFTPSVNTRETDKGYFISVDLPGVKKKDINIDINGNLLVVSGEKKYSDEVKEDDFVRIESRYGKYSRSFTIPEGVDIDKIEAKNKDGVLEVFLPKGKKEAKRIEVK